MNQEWRSARIAVKSVVSAVNPSHWSEARLVDLLERSRIHAQPEVLENPEERPLPEVIAASSRDADLVFMGLRDATPGGETDYACRLAELVAPLPTVVLVRAAGPFAGQLLDADSG